MPRRLTQAQFVERCKTVHGEKYDYTDTVYTYMLEKVSVTCLEHGEFTLSANDHVKGSGCPKCAHNFRYTTESFISKANEVHGGKYDYSETVYRNSKQSVTICCPTHGQFEQIASNHIRGHGCHKCDNKNLSNDEFVAKVKSVLGNEYDYSEVLYRCWNSKVTVSCPKHGKFRKIAYDLLKGIGCPRCKVNRSEHKWLDSLNIDTLERGKRLHIGKKYYIVDGYDPITNTVFEFHGDYWHGNPDVFAPGDINPTNKKPFGVLLKETQDKTSHLRSNGYNVVEMWENTWKGEQ